MATESPKTELEEAVTKSTECSSDRKRTMNETASKDQEEGDKVSDNLGTGEPDRKVRKTTLKTDIQETPEIKENTTDDVKQSASGSKKGTVSDIGPFVSAQKLTAECGDLIEIQRGFYSHWALYTSDGMVIHVTGPGGDIAAKEAECRKNTIAEVAGSSMVRVNNLVKQAEQKSLKVLDQDTILKNAEENIGKVVPYNLITRNCEHYVTAWRYGKGWSAQVDVGFSLLAPQSSDALLNTLAQNLEQVPGKDNESGAVTKK